MHCAPGDHGQAREVEGPRRASAVVLEVNEVGVVRQPLQQATKLAKNVACGFRVSLRVYCEAIARETPIDIVVATSTIVGPVRLLLGWIPLQFTRPLGRWFCQGRRWRSKPAQNCPNHRTIAGQATQRDAPGFFHPIAMCSSPWDPTVRTSSSCSTVVQVGSSTMAGPCSDIPLGKLARS